MVSTGVHGQGTTLLFTDMDTAETGFTQDVVRGMRRFVMNFVVSGDPNERGGAGVGSGVVWPVYGVAGKGLSVDGVGMQVVDATGSDEVLRWWVKGPLLN